RSRPSSSRPRPRTTARSSRPDRVAANSAVGPLTGWPIGFWLAELTHPYATFIEAGYDVEIRSPDGGTLQADSYSDPEDDSGYSAHDLLSLGFKRSPSHATLLDNTASIADVNAADYDAILLAGGQSPMVTFINNHALHTLVAAFYEAGKPTALLCHGTCVLLKAKLSTGELLVTSKTWTGFSNEEEKDVEQSVGQKVQPFWIETEARALPGTTFVVAPLWSAFAVRDGNLITGQQQTSGRVAAELVIEALSGVPSSAPTTRAGV
ncbi:MAG: type 1 glutamine amidotransferase domain-containing protein, partial [Planctomycetota bacterium]